MMIGMPRLGHPQSATIRTCQQVRFRKVTVEVQKCSPPKNFPPLKVSGGFNFWAFEGRGPILRGNAFEGRLHRSSVQKIHPPIIFPSRRFSGFVGGEHFWADTVLEPGGQPRASRRGIPAISHLPLSQDSQAWSTAGPGLAGPVQSLTLPAKL